MYIKGLYISLNKDRQSIVKDYSSQSWKPGSGSFLQPLADSAMVSSHMNQNDSLLVYEIQLLPSPALGMIDHNHAPCFVPIGWLSPIPCGQIDLMIKEPTLVLSQSVVSRE